MDAHTVKGNREIRHVYGISRMNERGIPVEVVGTAPDLQAAIDAAEIMGDDYVAGTWSYRLN